MMLCEIWDYNIWKSGLVWKSIELLSLDDNTVIKTVLESGFFKPISRFNKSRLSIVDRYPEKLLLYNGKVVGSVYLKEEAELYV